MRVISLVPSLTETLVECGVEVVGRTRYCIHPKAAVKQITIVGGTKSANWDRCLELDADLVILDREENTKEMAEACPLPWIATHITDLESVSNEMLELSERLGSAPLRELAGDWQTISASPNLSGSMRNNLSSLPGFVDWVGPSNFWSDKPFKRMEYLIWRDPWMAVSRDTFIGSVLNKVGFAEYFDEYPAKYPEITDIPRPDTFYLFSTEPYPFARHVDELVEAGFRGALVDGEFYSWFGIRSCRQLQEYMAAVA